MNFDLMLRVWFGGVIAALVTLFVFSVVLRVFG